jgi:nicotinamidase-related amidase
VSDGDISNPDRPAGPFASSPSLVEPRLLVVDMQYGDADPDSEYVQRKSRLLGDAAREYFLGRVASAVAQTSRLVQAFRAAQHPVVYARIQSLTRDGRDRGARHKELGIHFPPGSQDGQILEAIAPEPDEVVVSKTDASSFVGTGLADILHNLGGTDLVVVGVVTGGCVLASVKDGLGAVPGAVWVIDDATATWTPEMQAQAVAEMADAGARVIGADAALAQLDRP